MSDSAEKIRSVKNLPIFPLPLVLLPGEMLPLHIFEQRYRDMLLDVEKGDKQFGINLFDASSELEDRPPVGSIGCVAEVREVQPLPDGRSNILSFGVIRYTIEEYTDTDRSYFTAMVSLFEDDLEEKAELDRAADDIYSLFERVAKAAFDLSGNRGRFPAIERTDPERLSFVVTAAFNMENDVKYEMLELTSTLTRFDRLRPILETSVGRMEESAATHKAAQSNGHSKRSIDL